MSIKIQYLTLPKDLGEVVRREAKEKNVAIYKWVGHILSEVDLTKVGQFPVESGAGLSNEDFPMRLKLKLDSFLFDDLEKAWKASKVGRFASFLRRAIAYHATSNQLAWNGAGFVNPFKQDDIFKPHFKEEEPPKFQVQEVEEKEQEEEEQSDAKILREDEFEGIYKKGNPLVLPDLREGLAEEIDVIICSLQRMKMYLRGESPLVKPLLVPIEAKDAEEVAKNLKKQLDGLTETQRLVIT